MRSVRGPSALLLAVVLALAVPAVAVASQCKTSEGTFTAVATCPPPGICTRGELVGEFEGTYEFVATSVSPTGAYVGNSVITTPNGATIFGEDSGQLTFNGDGTASFVTTVEIVGGTRQYATASGTIVAPGTLDLATGDTTGTFAATICKGLGGDHNPDNDG